MSGKRERVVGGGANPVIVKPERSGHAPAAHYEAGLRDGAFRIQRCNGCGRHLFYARVGCPYCASADVVWLEPSGLGTVYSTTIVNRPADKGGPYNVALVDLEEGVRLMSRVDGIAPDDVKIGMAVRVAVEPVNGSNAPVFYPIVGGASR